MDMSKFSDRKVHFINSGERVNHPPVSVLTVRPGKTYSLKNLRIIIATGTKII